MPLTKEQRAKVAERLGKPADAPEDDLLAALIEDHEAQATDIADLGTKATALSADVSRLDREKADALALSANAPRKPDALTLSMYADNIAAKRESVVASGLLSEAQAKKIDALLTDADGNPNALALSASAGGRPHAFAVWNTLREVLSGDKEGVRTGNAVNRGNAADPPHRESMDLSGDARDSDEGKPVTPERRGELLALAGYNATAVK